MLGRACGSFECSSRVAQLGRTMRALTDFQMTQVFGNQVEASLRTLQPWTLAVISRSVSPRMSYSMLKRSMKRTARRASAPTCRRTFSLDVRACVCWISWTRTSFRILEETSYELSKWLIQCWTGRILLDERAVHPQSTRFHHHVLRHIATFVRTSTSHL